MFVALSEIFLTAIICILLSDIKFEELLFTDKTIMIFDLGMLNSDSILPLTCGENLI